MESAPLLCFALQAEPEALIQAVIFLPPLLKSKLEGYQDLRISGKNLTADQEVAVKKYEEVVQCLLCAQDLLKQIQCIFVVYEKEQKNSQRKVGSCC